MEKVENHNIEFNSQIRKLQNEETIKSIGPAKSGHWEVVE